MVVYCWSKVMAQYIDDPKSFGLNMEALYWITSTISSSIKTMHLKIPILKNWNEIKISWQLNVCKDNLSLLASAVWKESNFRGYVYSRQKESFWELISFTDFGFWFYHKSHQNLCLLPLKISIVTVIIKAKQIKTWKWSHT